jgi:hypothetical protein
MEWESGCWTLRSVRMRGPPWANGPPPRPAVGRLGTWPSKQVGTVGADGPFRRAAASVRERPEYIRSRLDQLVAVSTRAGSNRKDKRDLPIRRRGFRRFEVSGVVDWRGARPVRATAGPGAIPLPLLADGAPGLCLPPLRRWPWWCLPSRPRALLLSSASGASPSRCGLVALAVPGRS